LLEGANAFTGFEVERDTRAMDSDVYTTALIVAIQDNRGPFLSHLVTLRTELDDPLFERASASAIGRSTNPDHLDQIHDLILSEEMGGREAAGLIRNALAEPTLREQHWQWYVENFVAVVDKLPEQSRRFTPFFSITFCDGDKLEEVQQLFKQHGELVPGYQRSLAQTEEQIQLCMALRERGQAFAGTLTAR